MPGLRREEVAVPAGVSTEWYARLEKGHIASARADETLRPYVPIWVVRVDDDVYKIIWIN